MFIVGGYSITHVHRSCSLQHSLFKVPKRLKNKGKSSDDFIQSVFSLLQHNALNGRGCFHR